MSEFTHAVCLPVLPQQNGPRQERSTCGLIRLRRFVPFANNHLDIELHQHGSATSSMRRPHVHHRDFEPGNAPRYRPTAPPPPSESTPHEPTPAPHVAPTPRSPFTGHDGARINSLGKNPRTHQSSPSAAAGRENNPPVTPTHAAYANARSFRTSPRAPIAIARRPSALIFPAGSLEACRRRPRSPSQPLQWAGIPDPSQTQNAAMAVDAIFAIAVVAI